LTVRRHLKGKHLCLPVAGMLVALVFLGVTAGQPAESPAVTKATIRAEPMEAPPEPEPLIAPQEDDTDSNDPSPDIGPAPSLDRPDTWAGPKEIQGSTMDQYRVMNSGCHSGAFHT
jgi:hypothetical protein